jgi:hypothetical protein
LKENSVITEIQKEKYENILSVITKENKTRKIKKYTNNYLYYL